MKNIVITLLAASLGCGIAAAQQPMGQETKKEMKSEMKPMKTEKKAKTNKFMGTVEAFDMAAGRLTVKDHKGMTMVMLLGADTRIMKDGKQAAMTEIMPGEKVHVKYEGEMSDPMVKEVKLMGKNGMMKEKMEKMEKKEKKGGHKY